MANGAGAGSKEQNDNPYQVGAEAEPVKAPGQPPDLLTRMALPVGRSWWAIAAGYAGLFGLLIFPAPLALLLGVIAFLDLRKNPEKLGMGRAVFALLIGVVGTGLLIYMKLSSMSE